MPSHSEFEQRARLLHTEDYDCTRIEKGPIQDGASPPRPGIQDCPRFPASSDSLPVGQVTGCSPIASATPPPASRPVKISLARIIHKLSAAGPRSSALTALPTLGLLNRVHDYACAALGRNALSARRLRPFASTPDELCGLGGKGSTAPGIQFPL